MGGDSHAGRIQKTPIKHYKSIKTGNGADERAGDASLFGGAARASKDGDWSESYILQSVRLAFKRTGNHALVNGRCPMDLQGFLNAGTPR